MARSLWLGLRDRLDAERDRWALWLPVAFGVGIGCYFQLTREPPLWLGVAAAVLSLVALVALRPTAAGVAAAAGLFLVSAGFLAAELRSVQVAAPVLERRLGPTTIEARVLGVTKTATGHRLLLDHLAIGALAPEQTPQRLRLSLRTTAEPDLV